MLTVDHIIHAVAHGAVNSIVAQTAGLIQFMVDQSLEVATLDHFELVAAELQALAHSNWSPIIRASLLSQVKEQLQCTG